MNYILNPGSPWQINGTLKDNGDGTSSQPIMINPMVVGDEYGFTGPSSKNSTTVILKNVGSDIDQLKVACQTAAEAFCIKQYPDTK